MVIYFKTRKLQKLCSKGSEAIKSLGPKRGKKLKQRMMELAAAETLADISRVPPARCHELTGNRSGQLSVDLEATNLKRDTFRHFGSMAIPQ